MYKCVRVFKKKGRVRSSNPCVSHAKAIVCNRREKAVFPWTESKEVIGNPEHSVDCIRTLDNQESIFNKILM